MGRCYQLSKKITDAESELILKEIKALDDVDKVEITKDHNSINISAKEDQYTVVMGKVVNICSRIAGDLRLSFSKFALEA